ncbi:MAG: flagellar hook-basal body complex protein [Limnochordaceae bacterium]|nr:flagellar hook-basal body complex protein [Limnochordaceae bacterium]
MLRSLFSGVSGMRTHQLDMDVIADNIANVNTTGFKASRMTFKEVYSQLLKGARAPLGNMGGVNPVQVGLGVTTGSTDTLFTQGAPQATGRDTDLSINGNGFFVLTDGTNRYYTRAGNFTVDSNGSLVYTNGMKVLGWNAAAGCLGSLAN